MRKLFLISIFSAASLLIHAQNFVYLENGKFKLNGSDFYPIVANYIVNIVKVRDFYQVRPEHAYGHTNSYECNSETDCLNNIKAQLQLLKDLKFNCIRLCGFAVGEKNSDGKMVRITLPADLSSEYTEEMVSPYTAHFELLKKVLNIADAIGIKVIVLTGINNGKNKITIQNKYSDFLEKMAAYFSNTSAIMAYDLCNEPANTKPLIGSKTEICSIVAGWISKMKTVNNKHLITVGFFGSEEVIEPEGWDPSLIPVDFASFHPYPFSPYNASIVENEIYWYKNNIKKPWIIGETGTSNLTETPNFDEQLDLTRRTLRRVINCNGIGYSWWEYSDKVGWGGTHNDYAFGLVSNDGYSTTSTGQTIEGSVQPFAFEFANFVNNYTPDYNCPCLPNYFNDRGYNKYQISGIVKNANTNLPIEGAIVYGWDDNWVNYSTRTNPNGIFNLFSNTKISVLRASGISYSIEFNYLRNTPNVVLQNRTINIGANETQSTSGSITCQNFTIKGNGTIGGNVKLYGGENIVFQNFTSVEKGAYLVAEPKINYGEIKLTPINSCGMLKSNTIITDKSLNINTENKLNQEFNVYPNPSKGFINIQLNTVEQKTIELYDIFGKKILSKTTIEQISVLDISSLSSGIYMLKITTSNGSESRKIIRQ